VGDEEVPVVDMPKKTRSGLMTTFRPDGSPRRGVGAERPFPVDPLPQPDRTTPHLDAKEDGGNGGKRDAAAQRRYSLEMGGNNGGNDKKDAAFERY